MTCKKENCITDEKVIDDPRSKIFVGANESYDKLKFLEPDFMLVRVLERDGKYFFLADHGSEGLPEKESTEVPYLPSNVVAAVDISEEIAEYFDIAVIEKDVWQNEVALLKRLMELTSLQGMHRALELEKENARIRSFLENAKQTLLELSIFTNTHQIPQYFQELSWEPVEGLQNTLRLEPGASCRQPLPFSSMNLAGVAFGLSVDDLEERATLSDRLSVKVVGLESGRHIASWKIPFPLLEEKNLLELSAPYIETRESIVLCIENDGEIPVELLLSRPTWDERLWPVSVGDDIPLAQATLAIDLYKAQHNFSLTHAPFLEMYDTVIGESDRRYLSLEMLRRFDVLGEEELRPGEDLRVDLEEDTIVMQVLDQAALSLRHSLGRGVTAIELRYTVLDGEADLGVLVSPSVEKMEEIPTEKELEEYRKELSFSGWKKGSAKKGSSVIHLYFPEESTEIYDLNILVDNRSERRLCKVRIDNIAVVTDRVL